MGDMIVWPEYTPDTDVKIDVSNGTLTLVSPSKLRNFGDFTWGVGGSVDGDVYKGGSSAASISFNDDTRAMTITGFSVATDDEIEVRVEHTGDANSNPWDTETSLRRSAFWTVPSGGGDVLFDQSTNAMPVPTYRLTFGWDGSDKFKVGFKVTSDDGASQDLKVTTALVGTSPDKKSSSTIDLDDTTNVQAHTADFTKTDVGTEWEMLLHLKSGTGSTRQESRVHFLFKDVDAIDAYDSSFPTTGVLLKTSKVEGGARFGQP